MIVNDREFKNMLRRGLKNFSWSILAQRHVVKNTNIIKLKHDEKAELIKPYRNDNGENIKVLKIGSTYPDKKIVNSSINIAKTDIYLAKSNEVFVMDVETRIRTVGEPSLKMGKNKIISSDTSYKLVKRVSFEDFNFEEINFHKNPYEAVKKNINKAILFYRKHIAVLRGICDDIDNISVSAVSVDNENGVSV